MLFRFLFSFVVFINRKFSSKPDAPSASFYKMRVGARSCMFDKSAGFTSVGTFGAVGGSGVVNNSSSSLNSKKNPSPFIFSGVTRTV